MESDTRNHDPIEHRAPEYDAFNVNRPQGILTPQQRRVLDEEAVFNIDAVEAGQVDTDELTETVIHSLLDFHFLATSIDDNMLEDIFYEGGSADAFKPGVPSAPEAAVEEIIALIYRGIESPDVFHELLETGIERGHNLEGERCDISIDVACHDLETAEEIAVRLDENGTESASILDLQILYFAGVLTEEEYREISAENFLR